MATTTLATPSLLVLPKWTATALDEREKWFGELRSSCTCGKFTWDVAGSLLDHWNGRIHPRLLTLIHHNYDQIFKKNGKHALYLQLYLLAPAPLKSMACPTIVILTQDRSAAKRARKTIIKHELFEELNIGFDVLFERLSVLTLGGSGLTISTISALHDYWRGHPHEVQTKGIYESLGDIISDLENQRMPVEHVANQKTPEAISLSGVCVAITAFPLQQTPVWRRATITCTIKLGVRHFALLPSHVFYRDTQQNTDEFGKDIVQDGYLSSDSDASSTYHDLEQAQSPIQTQHANIVHTTYEKGQDELNHEQVVYLVPKDLVDNTSFDVELLRYVGRMKAHTNFYSPDHINLISRDLDIALVELHDARYQQASLDHLATDQSLELGVTPESSNRSVTILSGVSGLRHAAISSTAGTFIRPWSFQPLKVWEVTCTLKPGDSGSPVFNKDGAIIGMVVASVPARRLGLLIPTESVVKCIQEMVSHSPRSFDLQPATDKKGSSIEVAGGEDNSIDITGISSSRRRRVSEPRVTTGCITCKIRHVKCDELKPSCKRCLSTGRKCDGYDASKDIRPSSRESPRVEVSARTEKLSVSSFKREVIPVLDGDYHAKFWSHAITMASSHSSAMKNSLSALTALHMWFRGHGDEKYAQQTDEPLYQTAIQRYGTALRETNKGLAQSTGGNKRLVLCMAVTFTCFEVMRRHNMTAIIHFHAGLKELLRQINGGDADAISQEKVAHLNDSDLDLDVLMRIYTDYTIQFASWLGSHPGLIAQIPVAQPLPLPLANGEAIVEQRHRMSTVVLAALQVFDAMPNWTFYDPNFTPSWEMQTRIQNLMDVLDEWSDAFERFDASSCGNRFMVRSLLGLLCQLKIARLKLRLMGSPSINVYDENEGEFEAMLVSIETTLAKETFMPMHKTDGENLLFIMQNGVIYPLFFIATQCPSRRLKKRAIEQMKTSGKEGVWEGSVMAEVATQVMWIDLLNKREGRRLLRRSHIHEIRWEVEYENRTVSIEYLVAEDDTLKNWTAVQEAIPL